MNDSTNNIPNPIIEKIKSGKITMHSRGYLVWKRMLWILAICLLAAAGIFILSFIIFTLKVSGVWDLPKFGTHGLKEFLIFFPWLFIPAILLFLWLLERFMLQFSFVYKMPIVYSALGLLIITVAGSIIVLKSPLHYKILTYAHNQPLPLAGPVYKFYGHSRPNDFYTGIVTQINKNSYTLTTADGDQKTVTTNNFTKWFADGPLQNGDCVEVVLEEHNNIISAIVIKKTLTQNVVGCNELLR